LRRRGFLELRFGRHCRILGIRKARFWLTLISHRIQDGCGFYPAFGQLCSHRWVHLIGERHLFRVGHGLLTRFAVRFHWHRYGWRKERLHRQTVMNLLQL